MPKKQNKKSRLPSLEERAIQAAQFSVSCYSTEIERRLREISKICEDAAFSMQLLRRLSIKR